MLAFWFLILLNVPQNLSILTIPVAYAQEVTWEQKDIQTLEQCESTGSTTIKILDTNNKFSYGILQFQMGTWLKYKKLGTTKDNIYDQSLQESVATYMIDNPKDTGGLYNWYYCSIRNKLLGEKIE